MNMKANEIINKAAEIVAGDREKSYGDKVQNHKNIADLWSAYLGVPISPGQAAIMMLLLKVARTKTGSGTEDNYVDMAGYAGVAGEINSKDKVPSLGDLVKVVPVYNPPPPFRPMPRAVVVPANNAIPVELYKETF